MIALAALVVAGYALWKYGGLTLLLVVPLIWVGRHWISAYLRTHPRRHESWVAIVAFAVWFVAGIVPLLIVAAMGVGLWSHPRTARTLRMAWRGIKLRARTSDALRHRGLLDSVWLGRPRVDEDGWTIALSVGAGRSLGDVERALPAIIDHVGVPIVVRRTAPGAATLKLLAVASVRTQLDEALSTLKLGAHVSAPAEESAVGPTFDLALNGGTTVGDLEARSDALASSLGSLGCECQSVRVAGGSAGHATVTLVERNPLDGDMGRWPGAGTIWSPIPVGKDENGGVVTLDLVYNSCLLGGVPNSGKSSAIQMVVATGAMDADTRMFLIDGKLVELGPWRHCAERFASEPDDAIAILRAIQGEMEQRYRELAARPGVHRKVERGDGYRLILLVIDELARYTVDAPSVAEDFNSLLGDLVRRGRAVGVIVVAATQKPDSSVISTQVRDNIGLKWAMRTERGEATAAILGAWEPAAHHLPILAGIGYLKHESGTYRILRTFYLTDGEIEEMIARLSPLRAA